MITYCVGIVTDVSLRYRDITSEKPVSLSTSKEKAKELTENGYKRIQLTSLITCLKV